MRIVLIECSDIIGRGGRIGGGGIAAFGGGGEIAPIYVYIPVCVC